MKCRHCGRPIRPAEESVDAEWIHEMGFYQCPGSFGAGIFAEPGPNEREP
jgi:hypothetical protein